MRWFGETVFFFRDRSISWNSEKDKNDLGAAGEAGFALKTATLPDRLYPH
jgi:hypothetical protein